jgi:4-hydroxybenzoate polyprenyltransferase
MSSPYARLSRWGNFVKFSHTIFALPFALGIFVLCTARVSVTWEQFLGVLLCLVTARTSAMAVNRIVDRDIDAKNPRTSSRELPAGLMTMKEAVLLWGGSTVLFLIGSYALGWHCFVLSPLVLIILWGYSFAKRFTSGAHILLGLALALAPGGVWYALTAEWSFVPVPLMFAVLFWVAGFDILYSCQDTEFDRTHGLHSIPSRLGVSRAFTIARFSHIFAVLFLLLFGETMGLSWWYYLFVAIFSLFLVRQHLMLSPRDLSRIDAAFFTQNGYASVSFLLAAIVERLFLIS